MQKLNNHITLFTTTILLVFGFCFQASSQLTNSGNFRTHTEGNVGLFCDFTNNGTFSSNLGEMYLAGTDSINLTGSSPFQVDSLIVIRTDDTKLDQQLEVSSHATFTTGIIYSDKADKATEFVHFTDDATHLGASDASHVDGVVRKTGNDAFVFPVGDYLQIQEATISAPLLVTDHFTAHYHQVSPFVYGFDTYQKENGLNHVSLCEFWIID